MKTQSKETPIGITPEDWKVERLKSVIVEAKPGFACGRRDDNGIIQLRMDSINPEGWINSDAYVKVPVTRNLEQYILEYGDVLFNNTNSADLIGKTAIFKGEFSKCTYSNHLTRIRVNPNKVLPEWVLLVLIRNWQCGTFKAIRHQHVHQAGINKGDLLYLKIPVPPMKEQRKVVEVLSGVDDAIRKVDVSIAKTERLKKGLMRKLLTEGIGHKEFRETKIGKIPKTWKVVELGDVIAYEKGRKPKKIFAQEVPNSLPYLSAGVLRTEEFNNWAKQNGEVVKVNKDDLILIWDGFYCGDVFTGLDGILSSTMIKMKTTGLDRVFLFYFLKTRSRELNIKHVGMYLKHVSKRVFKSLKVPLPYLSEQQRIAEILSTVDHKLQLDTKRKGKLERIKNGLMNDLLTGRRRVRVAM